MKPEFRRYPDLDALSLAAAEFICTWAEERVTEDGLFNVALAGGNTPKILYETLARKPFDARMSWPHTHLFWGDERCVPPDHPDSNFRMAFDALISRASVPSGNVHRIPGEISPPEEAARGYEKILRELFKPPIKGYAKHPLRAEEQGFPRFDLIILGVGADGHTASLFPEDEALEEKIRWVAAVNNPRGSPFVPRITFTLPVINRAKCVLFMVSGAGKKDVVRSVVSDLEGASRFYPAARVRPEGRLLWFLDEKSFH